MIFLSFVCQRLIMTVPYFSPESISLSTFGAFLSSSLIDITQWKFLSLPSWLKLESDMTLFCKFGHISLLLFITCSSLGCHLLMDNQSVRLFYPSMLMANSSSGEAISDNSISPSMPNQVDWGYEALWERDLGTDY